MSNLLTHTIEERPDYPLLRIQLQPGQKVFAEPGSMVTMQGVQLRAGFAGGIKKAVGRVFSGESLVMNTYTSEGSGGEVTFAPPALGDVQHVRIDGSTLMLQRGAFLAHGEGIDMSASWGGARGFFSGAGLVLLRVTGRGDLFFNSFGALIPMDVDGELIVDTGYVVGFDHTLDYQIRTMPTLRPGMWGKVKSFLMGGEGLVCHFNGRGRVWVQARQLSSWLSWVQPFRPVKQSNSGSSNSLAGSLTDLVSDSD